MSLRIGITGASGYIGECFSRHVQLMGCHAVAIGRRPSSGVKDFRVASLDSPPADDLLAGLDAVVHLAASTSGESLPDDSEVRFASRLATQAGTRQIPILVVSSQTAAQDAASVYGRTKFAIEGATLSHGAIIVRPGLVYGGPEKGLFGQLVRLARHLPVLPALFPRVFVQPIHVEDLAIAMFSIVKYHPQPRRIWMLAGPRLSFTRFLLQISRYRLGMLRILIPVPIVLLRFLLRISGRMLGPRFSPERLDSLAKLPELEAEADMRELQVAARRTIDGLSPHGNGVHNLILEGHVLMRAFLGHPPDPFATRRYARSVAVLCSGQSLCLPWIFRVHPMFISALDTPGFRRKAQPGDLAWRYAVAVRLCETRPNLAGDYLLRQSRSGLVVAFYDALRSSLIELRSVCLRPLARRFAKEFE